MNFEVELKFALSDAAGAEEMRRRFELLGAIPQAPIDQRDIYFEHPCRQFAQTDEAFRLRCVGDQNCLTYKGPLVDSVTKTRREIEVATAAGRDAAVQLVEMLSSLGFQPVHEVAKQRSPFHLKWLNREVELVLDNVDGLGWYLELETIADEASCDAARELLFSLARELQLGTSERRSYLRLLLEKEREKNRA